MLDRQRLATVIGDAAGVLHRMFEASSNGN
jgi:hypothetical protein